MPITGQFPNKAIIGRAHVGGGLGQVDFAAARFARRFSRLPIPAIGALGRTEQVIGKLLDLVPVSIVPDLAAVEELMLTTELVDVSRAIIKHIAHLALQ